jgi:hypothetical protein
MSRMTKSPKVSSGSSTGLNRITTDKFYTKTTVALQCVDNIRRYVLPKTTDLIIEPSAGDGSFLKILKDVHLTDAVVGYDLHPCGDDIIEMDYLKPEGTTSFMALVNEYREMGNNIHVVGNPPFGRQSSLAIKFIKKSCEYCQSISFILPKSFKKASMKSHFPPLFHPIFETELPPNSFMVNGIDHDVPCVFQIWKKHTYSREILPKSVPDKFVFVKKNEHPDISFRRVGVNAGKIDTNSVDKSEQSHYFIQFQNGLDLFTNIHSIQNITFPGSTDTVGPKSISKQEVIRQFNEIL